MSVTLSKKTSISTGRLTLKPFSSNDRDRLAECLQKEEIYRTYMVPEFESEEQVYAVVDILVSYSQPEDTEHYMYGIFAEGEMIGLINDCGIENGSIEIGYFIDPAYQGHGFATEALKAALADLRDMGFRKVVTSYFEGNEASRKVMEKCGLLATGYVNEGVYRGKKLKCHYHEIVF